MWRYRLDNRTHAHKGYNVFVEGIADGEQRAFSVAISEKQQQKVHLRIGTRPRTGEYTYLVGHAWDLMSALFSDLSGIWSSWGSEPATHVSDMNITDQNGLAVLLPMLVSALICSVLVDVAAIVGMVVVWGRGMQLYFMATMSPIPLALLGIDETRQMGIGFLRNFAGLVLGYAALSFVIKLFPTLLQMAIATSFVMGGDGEMLLSITAASALEVILVAKCGSWAREVLGG